MSKKSVNKVTKKTCDYSVPKKKKRFKREYFELYALMAIPILLVLVFNYLPMGGIVIAFKNYKFNKGIWGSAWVGLKNIEFFFKSDVIWRITRNTIVLNLLFIGVELLCGLAIAVLLYEVVSRRAVKVFQTTLITPNFVSWVVASYIVYAILNPNSGILNSIIEAFGGTPVDWYSNAKMWPVILVICDVWKHVGMGSIWYYAALMGVDTTLIESAKIDGANRWQVMKQILIPLIVPIIVIRFILAIGGIFRADFGLFYQVTRNVPLLYETTDVIDTYIFRAMREDGNMSMSAAVGLLQSIIGFIMVMITNAITKKINPDNALM